MFHHDLRLMVWRPTKIINEKAVNKIIEFIATEETESNQPFNRFTDTLLVEAVELNFRYMFHVSLYRRLSYSGRAPVKSAILVANETVAHYARLHRLLTQGSPLQVSIFENRAKAARWLGVSLETLEYWIALPAGLAMAYARELARRKALQAIKTAGEKDWRAHAEWLRLVFPSDYRGNGNKIEVSATAQTVVLTEEERLKLIERQRAAEPLPELCCD
jgi:Arc/MetJ family transcription regulator